MKDLRPPQLGIRANIGQFVLLIIVNVFVGAMVGMERSTLPLVAENIFGIASRSAILSFLVSFGIVKALTNLLAGRFSDLVGRKKLLVLGWVAGVPVPFMLMWAPSWSWVVAANILLGINQGLCWSMTVIMKIDLAGPKRRGFAMGLNEFAGYIAVALAAFASAVLAEKYGLRPVPFYLGVVCSVAGMLLSILFVKETQAHARAESLLSPEKEQQRPSGIFLLTSWKNKSLFSCSQAGLVNNLNDGMVWGLFPLLYASLGFTIARIGLLAGLYPMVWGCCQLFTGAMSDKYGRKWMIAAGMWLQAIGILMVALAPQFGVQLAASVILGLGTAMVYPTLLAAVGDIAHPGWRASAVGIYRLWRDLGYAIGAVVAGIVADFFGVNAAIVAVALLTFLSGVIVALKFSDAHTSGQAGQIG